MSLLENIHLICNATGGTKAPSGIDWFFDGNPVTESNPRVQILKHRPIPGRSYISELIKEKATLKDRGSYVCRSSDRIVQGLKVHVLNGMFVRIVISFYSECFSCCAVLAFKLT